MKFIVTAILVFSQLIAFSQTKEDFLTCFEIITEHDDFQPAYENRGITGESLIITSSYNRSITSNKYEKIRQSLTSDDFYDFRERIKVIQGDDETVKNQGYDPMLTLRFSFSGRNDQILFNLSTVVDNQNLSYNWNYKFAKEGDEWVLIGKNVKKNKVR